MSNIPTHQQAETLFNNNQLGEALSLYRLICAREPNDIQAWHMAGAIAGMLGDYVSAKACCEKVIELNPVIHGAYLNLANILLATGLFQEAEQRFQQALQIKPGDAEALTNMANLHVKLGRLNDATNCLLTVVHSNPSHVEAYNNLGTIYRETGKLDTAESYFRKALKIKPDYIDAICNLGAVLSDSLQFTAAESCYSSALKNSPNNLFVLRNLGNLYQSTGAFSKARSCYERALACDTSDTTTQSCLASLHERCGNHEGALSILKPLISSGQFTTDTAITYAKLCRRKGEPETGILLLEKTLQSSVGSNQKINTFFALGELYDSIGKYEQAFSYFKQGNDMDNRSSAAIDLESYFNSITGFFTKKRFDSLARSTIRSDLPIYIVGMPRTGTSLVEQILASHPLVVAGGERSDVFNIASSLGELTGISGEYPQLLESLTTIQLDSIATSYLDTITSLTDSEIRFTDKTPLHGLHLGLINLILPGSRIIVCERNPMDTCLSVYFNRFNTFHAYATNLDNLGRFYKRYYKLIDHWSSIIDIPILHVQYEELVHNTERVVRRIVDFCELDWDPACLAFYKNRRTVNTPSYDQVRHPIYSKSVDRWKYYEKHLEPLKQALYRTV